MIQTPRPRLSLDELIPTCIDTRLLPETLGHVFVQSCVGRRGGVDEKWMSLRGVKRVKRGVLYGRQESGGDMIRPPPLRHGNQRSEPAGQHQLRHSHHSIRSHISSHRGIHDTRNLPWIYDVCHSFEDHAAVLGPFKNRPLAAGGYDQCGPLFLKTLGACQVHQHSESFAQVLSDSCLSQVCFYPPNLGPIRAR
jgi:hypothetical protein